MKFKDLKQTKGFTLTAAAVMSVITTLAFFSNRLPLNYNLINKDMHGDTSFLGLAFSQLYRTFEGTSLQAAIVFIALFLLYKFFYEHYQKKDGRILRGSVFIGIVLGGCMLLGTCLEKTGKFDFILYNAFTALLACVLLFGYAYLFYVVSYIIIKKIVDSRINTDDPDFSKKPKIAKLVFEKHPVLFAVIILLLCWTPHIIAFFPGVVSWDGLRQLDFYIGSLEWTKFHPVASTWLMGVIVETGRKIFGSDNMGAFLYNFLQTVGFAFCIGYGMSLLKKWKCPYWLRTVILAFFALDPMWISNAFTLIKDTSYTMAMFLFVLLFLDYIHERGSFAWYKWIFFGLTALSVCLLRNNGIYVMIVCLPFMVIFAKKQRLKMFVTIGLAAASFLVFNLALVPALGIKGGDAAEMLSVPFQQTARYVSYYKDEIPDDEREVIASVLHYDTLKQDYRPDLSDPVKVWYSQLNKDNSNLPAYFKVWAKQLAKHPMAYIEATANNTYGYFYPHVNMNSIGYYYHAKDPYVDHGDYNFTMPESLQWYRSASEGYMHALTKLPVIGLLFTTGFWDWILFGVSVFLIIIKKGKLLAATLPLWLTFAFCIVGPANSYMRYLLPNVMVLPFMMAWIWFIMKQPDTAKPSDLITPPKAEEVPAEI